MSPDVIAGAFAFLFTLSIFSYLIGDNPLYRITVHLFVGVSAGYVASVVWWQVLLPDLGYPLIQGSMTQRAWVIVPLVLGVLMLMKISPRLSNLGGPAMAYLVGVSAAVAIGGAVSGTLLPQFLATVNIFDLRAAASPFDVILNGTFILAGVVTTLAYFHFGARMAADGSVRRFGLIELIAFIGGIFLAVTLGVLFAGVYSAALAAFIERLHFFAAFIGLQ